MLCLREKTPNEKEGGRDVLNMERYLSTSHLFLLLRKQFSSFVKKHFLVDPHLNQQQQFVSSHLIRDMS